MKHRIYESIESEEVIEYRLSSSNNGHGIWLEARTPNTEGWYSICSISDDGLCRHSELPEELGLPLSSGGKIKLLY